MNTPANLPPHEPGSERCLPASLDEILHAEALRREIHQRYLADAHRPSDPYWSVGAD